MKARAVVVSVAVLLFTGAGMLGLASDIKEDLVKQGRAKYVGTWRVIALEVNGAKAPDKDCRMITVVNEADGRWTIQVEGKRVSCGTGQIDPTKQPKTIDFIPSEGRTRGQVYLGIYELGDNTRKLCYADPGKVRPTGFWSLPGSGYVLVTLERVSAK